MDLEDWSTRLKVFADATRVRLLALLEQEELTVAELSAITRLAQPRVSTHLARLKEAGLVRDRRARSGAGDDWRRSGSGRLHGGGGAQTRANRAAGAGPAIRQRGELAGGPQGVQLQQPGRMGRHCV